jgi:cell wall-associated NlpC family hydrolase
MSLSRLWNLEEAPGRLQTGINTDDMAVAAENSGPEGADCSGAVCLALYAAAGLLIRTTADDLYRRVFTKVTPQPSDIRTIQLKLNENGN